MTDKKTRYTLTAAVGDRKPGSSVELTAAQAASPLYASRIAPISGDAAEVVDMEALRDEIRAQIMGEIERNIPHAMADAKAKGEKLIAEGKQIKDDAQAEALKLIESANAEAKSILAKAEADAKVIATKK